MISVEGKRQIVLNGEFGDGVIRLTMEKNSGFAKLQRTRLTRSFLDGKLIFVVNGNRVTFMPSIRPVAET